MSDNRLQELSGRKSSGDNNIPIYSADAEKPKDENLGKGLANSLSKMRSTNKEKDFDEQLSMAIGDLSTDISASNVAVKDVFGVRHTVELPKNAIQADISEAVAKAKKTANESVKQRLENSKKGKKKDKESDNDEKKNDIYIVRIEIVYPDGRVVELYNADKSKGKEKPAFIKDAEDKTNPERKNSLREPVHGLKKIRDMIDNKKKNGTYKNDYVPEVNTGSKIDDKSEGNQSNHDVVLPKYRGDVAR